MISYHHLMFYLVLNLVKVNQIVHKNFRCLKIFVLDFSLDGGARGGKVFPFISGVAEIIIDN